jgi:hypothetical protein
MSVNSDLTARISLLQTALAKLQLDAPQAISDFQRILLEANETKAILLVAGVVAAPAGTTVNLPVTLIPSAFKPTAIQADFVLPPSMTFVSATLGPLPLGEGKSIQTNLVGGAVRVLVFGLNQTPISEGLDFTLNLKTTVKGQFPILLQNPVASDGTGNTLPLCVTSGIVGVQ